MKKSVSRIPAITNYWLRISNILTGYIDSLLYSGIDYTEVLLQTDIWTLILKLGKQNP